MCEHTSRDKEHKFIMIYLHLPTPAAQNQTTSPIQSLQVNEKDDDSFSCSLDK